MSTSRRPKMTAFDRERRRQRIMALVRGGISYDSIARAEKLTRERIRQIVVKSLKEDREFLNVDTRLLNAARLEPALQLAARAVAEGRLQAINPLIKVMDRMDKYTPPAHPRYDGDARAKLLAKINLNVRRLDEARERNGEKAPQIEENSPPAPASP